MEEPCRKNEGMPEVDAQRPFEMQQSAEAGHVGQTEVPRVAGEEKEAVRNLRMALQNPHGIGTEKRNRVVSAWQTLRSVATSPSVQINSDKRQRKRRRLEAKAKKKNGDRSIDGEHTKQPLPRKKDEVLHEAAQLGQADLVKELISGGSRVSSKDNMGYSALHWASLYGHVEVVRVLLSLGAGDGRRINRQNDAGNTALHLACLGHHAQVAAKLVIYNPDVHLMNAYDQSPISLGLRELVESIEKIQHLDNIQAFRTDIRQRLLFESLDLHMRDSEGAASVASDSRWEKSINKEYLRCWKEYETAWLKFVEKFTVTSGTEDSAMTKKDTVSDTGRGEALGPGTIHFQDVPWPVTGMHLLTGNLSHGDRLQDKEGLLLAQLGVTGASLHPLIQRERLRWHPDKFVQLFGRCLALEDKSTILAGVHTVCQLLNSLADGAGEKGEN